MIYYQDKPIQIGDNVTIGELKLTLSQNMVDDNPHLFVEKTPKYIKLLGFLPGGLNASDVYECIQWSNNALSFTDIRGNIKYLCSVDSITCVGEATLKEFEAFKRLTKARKDYPSGTLIRCVKDNEMSVVGTLLLHEDGESIYHHPGSSSHKQFVYCGGKWAKKVTKDLQYYEALVSKQTLVRSVDGFQYKHPRVFYTEVLSVIAKDLNLDAPTTLYDKCFIITKDADIVSTVVGAWSITDISFNTRASAEEALAILGDAFEHLL